MDIGIRCGTRLVLLLGLALASPAAAGTAKQEEPRTGLLRMEAVGQPQRDCWLYVPRSYDRTKAYALVVVLHPAGLRGQRPAQEWGEVAERSGEFVVAVPECKDQKKRLWAMGDELGLIATIQKVIANCHVDATRVLLTGFSQGGIYTYTFGLRNPHVFRAMAPVSGALVARPGPASDRILQAARGMAVYIAHGTVDDRIPVARARASRDRLEKLGYAVRYRELAYLGHAYPQGESDRIWAWFKALTEVPAEEKKE